MKYMYTFKKYYIFKMEAFENVIGYYSRDHITWISFFDAINILKTRYQ